jgi:hypothetical protein
MVIFSFGWTPMQALYPAEVLSYQSRAKGLAFLNVVTQGASCINTFGWVLYPCTCHAYMYLTRFVSLPVALEKLGWKTYVIFLVWDSFEVLMIYFFMVETKV